MTTTIESARKIVAAGSPADDSLGAASSGPVRLRSSGSMAHAENLPAEPAEPECDSWIGRSLAGRFTVLGKVGMGSMGTVYRATQDAMARQVAVKILRPERALDDQAKARFLREARTTSLLTSPHTVTVFDFGESDDGELYLAMELLQGESLGQRLARVSRMPYRDAVDAARQALRSLGEAHGKGIVHRDLKPDNLFFAQVHAQGEDSGELLKVLDFGIAKMLRGEHASLNAVETQAGTVFGTPRYMSPEQAQGKQLDARSDLYSLGVILYHMLTGSPPFTDDDAIMVMARHIKTEPVRPRLACPEAEIPDEIEAVVRRALSKDPDSRPASAEDFSIQLQHALEASQASESGKDTPRAAVASRRAWAWILGGIVVGMAVVAIAWRMQPQAPRVLSDQAAMSRKAPALPILPAVPASAAAVEAPTEAPVVPSGAPDPEELSTDPSSLPASTAKGNPRAGHGHGKTSPLPPASANKSVPIAPQPSYGIFEN